MRPPELLNSILDRLCGSSRVRLALRDQPVNVLGRIHATLSLSLHNGPLGALEPLARLA